MALTASQPTFLSGGEVSERCVCCFQIRTRAISAKGMTLVSPLQLLLFACKKVTSNGEIVELDDW